MKLKNKERKRRKREEIRNCVLKVNSNTAFTGSNTKISVWIPAVNICKKKKKKKKEVRITHGFYSKVATTSHCAMQEEVD